ncbi:MAG: LEM-3-like GIY-YIG domain-containing protein [Phycisphaerales bacterium]
MNRFTPKVIEQIGFYVYLYIDPRTEKVFYIGKGLGNRVFSHLRVKDDSEKTKIISELDKLKIAPRIELLKYGLDEEKALLVEATAIDLINISNLTNAARGHGSRYGARATVQEVQATLSAEPVVITHDVLLININREFRYGMSAIELYDATRSAWKLGSKRNSVKYAISVYRGVVREVYSVAAWVPSGSTMRQKDESTDGRSPHREGRWEFVGEVAEEAVRNKYVGKTVSAYFKPGSQNPVKYVNCNGVD